METEDTLWAEGRLTITQPRRKAGYRFNLDSVLLANFCPGGDHVVDLGAGCGVVGVLLLAAGKAQTLTLVERDAGMAALCRRNAERNGFGERCRVLEGDFRTINGLSADHVVFNPPYFKVGAGREAQNAQVECARREHHGTLSDFVQWAERTSAGHWSAIVPFERSEELRAQGLPLLGRPIRQRGGQDPSHMLATRSEAETTQDELVVYDDDPDRKYTVEVAEMLRIGARPVG